MDTQIDMTPLILESHETDLDRFFTLSGKIITHFCAFAAGLLGGYFWVGRAFDFF